MADDDLRQFLAAAKARGATDQFLAEYAKQKGWPERKVIQELGSLWEESCGVSLPAHAGAFEGARDAFLYLLSFATLGIWTTAIGSIYFELIDRKIPDPLSPHYYYNSSGVAWTIAAAIVSYPIYMLVMRVIGRGLVNNPQRAEAGVRKWLTYLALFLTALVLVGDSVTVLGKFLLGEFTARFLWKAAVVGGIAGGVLLYYLQSVTAKADRGRAFALISAVVVGLGFVAGATMMHSREDQRMLEADRQRVSAIRNLASHIRSNPGQVPANYAEAARTLPAYQTKDPITRQDYEYVHISDTEFSLCANFDLATNESELAYEAQFWTHKAGRHCYMFDVRKPAP